MWIRRRVVFIYFFFFAKIVFVDALSIIIRDSWRLAVHVNRIAAIGTRIVARYAVGTTGLLRPDNNGPPSSRRHRRRLPARRHSGRPTAIVDSPRRRPHRVINTLNRAIAIMRGRRLRVPAAHGARPSASVSAVYRLKSNLSVISNRTDY